MATKGSAMLATVKALRKYGKEEALELLPPPLHKYLRERVLVTEWYPTEDVVALLRVLAALIRKHVPDLGADVYGFMGRVVAQTDLRGTYAYLLKPGDPLMTLRSAVTQYRAYWDNGTLKLEILARNRARMERNRPADPGWRR